MIRTRIYYWPWPRGGEDGPEGAEPATGLPLEAATVTPGPSDRSGMCGGRRKRILLGSV